MCQPLNSLQSPNGELVDGRMVVRRGELGEFRKLKNHEDEEIEKTPEMNNLNPKEIFLNHLQDITHNHKHS